ncbi:hypothetical protein [Pseudomonas sp. 008]|uniref:hypothetical protein n=1 Tax=Pseudomonas sp. 008 TaxID=2803906 RepID=UPI0019514321|nr:hypothetical protein [Pseudomonas sp. 008]
MDASLPRRKLHIITKVMFQVLLQQTPARRVDSPHFSDMTGEMAFLREMQLSISHPWLAPFPIESSSPSKQGPSAIHSASDLYPDLPLADESMRVNVGVNLSGG